MYQHIHLNKLKDVKQLDESNKMCTILMNCSKKLLFDIDMEKRLLNRFGPLYHRAWIILFYHVRSAQRSAFFPTDRANTV